MVDFLHKSVGAGLCVGVAHSEEIDLAIQENEEDVRIAIERLDRWGKPGLLELEAILIRATEPPYNVKIPMEN